MVPWQGILIADPRDSILLDKYNSFQTGRHTLALNDSLDQYQQMIDQYVQQHLPHPDVSGLRLDAIEEERLVMSAPLEQHHNEMGQAFGTGIYTVCHMACWSALYLHCIEHIKKPRILTRDAQIRYRNPVDADRIVAQCRLPNATQWKGFFAHYRNTGKTSLTLTSRIYSGKQIDVYFDGVFVLLGEEPA